MPELTPYWPATIAEWILVSGVLLLVFGLVRDTWWFWGIGIAALAVAAIGLVTGVL